MKKIAPIFLALIIISTGTFLLFKKSTHASLETLEPIVPVIEEEDNTITDMQEVPETTPIPVVPLTPSSTNTNANITDSDGDGLSDAIELQLGTDPTNPDTDGDSYTDGEEIDHGYSPLNPVADHAALTRTMQADLTHQQIYYLANNVIVRSFPISSGLRGKETPRGTFKILKKVPLADYRGPGYYLPNVQWNMEFKPSYYIHGTYWHNEFGIQAMSHGCINVSTENAKKIYDFLQVGDQVTISGKTPTGKVTD